MAIYKYAVLDSSQIVVNLIMVNDPMPTNYWPGYGMYLVYQGPTGGTPTISTLLTVPAATPTLSLRIGDFMNVNTGLVLRYVPNLITQDGQTVSSAPSIKLKNDANIHP